MRDSEPGAFLFGSWKNVFIAVWECQATASALNRLAKATAAHAANHPKGSSSIHIIADGAGIPTPQVRAQFVELMKTHAARLACVAVIIGGTGFWTSTLRSFVTGLRWLAPRSFEFRLHGSVAEVGKWLPAEHFKRTGVELDPGRLGQLLAEWAEPRKQGQP